MYRRRPSATRCGSSKTVAVPSSVTHTGPCAWHTATRLPGASMRFLTLRDSAPAMMRTHRASPSQLKDTGTTCGVPSGSSVVSVAMCRSARKVSIAADTGQVLVSCWDSMKYFLPVRARRLLPGELGTVQVGVQSVGREQFLVSPALADLTLVDDQDLVGLEDGGQPVGDDQ